MSRDRVRKDGDPYILMRTFCFLYSLLRRVTKARIVVKQTLTHNPSLSLPLKRADPGNDFASERKKIVIYTTSVLLFFSDIKNKPSERKGAKWLLVRKPTRESVDVFCRHVRFARFIRKRDIWFTFEQNAKTGQERLKE